MSLSFVFVCANPHFILVTLRSRTEDESVGKKVYDKGRKARNWYLLFTKDHDKQALSRRRAHRTYTHCRRLITRDLSRHDTRRSRHQSVINGRRIVRQRHTKTYFAILKSPNYLYKMHTELYALPYWRVLSCHCNLRTELDALLNEESQVVTIRCAQS